MAAVLCDIGEEGGDELYGFENDVEVFRPMIESSSSDVTLSWHAELRRTGSDKGGLGAAESTESASDKESVELVVWERWDKEADRGEMGGETLDVERKEEMSLRLSQGAVFGRRPVTPSLTAKS